VIGWEGRCPLMKIYVLQHVHPTEDDAEDVKFVGVYSSRENAQAAIARLSQTPGFSEAPAGFHIDEYQLDKDQWVEGYAMAANS
jgi:hypothetical protein